MELSSNMDKKNQRGQGQLAKNGQEPNGKNLLPESVSKKNGSQYPRKREFDNGKGAASKRGSRQGQRYVRTREKMGGQVETGKDCSEFGSLQHGGSKKQNIAHLLNWWGSSTQSDRYGRKPNSSGQYHGKTRKSHLQRYNKEHFVQANCQFVVCAGEDYSACVKDPDHLVNWDLVEEVRLHVSDDQSCPICLHSPSAAKVTRCGHVYCFPCILHYLALSDDKWRKCPICYEPVGKEDLKSVVVIFQKDFQLGEMLEFQLMRRERECLIPCPVLCYDPEVKFNGVVSLKDPAHVLAYAKLVTATKEEVIEHILHREQIDLENQLVNEGDEPEACFIQEALALVSSKRDFLKNGPVLKSTSALDQIITGKEDLNLNSHFDQMSLNTDFAEKFVDSRKVSESSDSIGSLDVSLSGNTFEESNVTYLRDLKHANQNDPRSTYYFYQAVNGAHLYLHSINSRMLIKQFGSLELCPPKICGKVIEKQSESMTVDLRSRLRNLSHLPVTSSFDLVEIEIPAGLISKEVLDEFQGHLLGRERNRRKRLKDEAKVDKRVQKEEDRMMGRSRGANVHLSSYKHFPNFVEEEPDASLGNYPALHAADESLISSSSESEWSASTFSGAISKSSRAKPTQTWPSLSTGSAWSSSSPNTGASWHSSASVGGISAKTSSCDSEEDGMERAPNFNASFSDAFAKALDCANKDVGSGGSDRRGKKAKKKKGIVLLSSGGFH